MLNGYEIITHRGLERSQSNPKQSSLFLESSIEAFGNHLGRGYGIEFDPRILADSRIIVTHDSSLSRITEGHDSRDISTLTSMEVSSLKFKSGRLGFLEEILALIRASNATVSALHLKGQFQEEAALNIFIENILPFSDLFPRLIVFDVKPEAAKFLKAAAPSLILAPSVAHSYDIDRYQKCVQGTLLSVEEAISLRDIYDWVWLDEWDRTGPNGTTKALYSEGVFSSLRDVGYKIALVTPELHGSSPGLLGGEAHQDAITPVALFKRMIDILALCPDAVCTDYPEDVREL